MNYADPRPTALSLVDAGDLPVEDLWERYRARGGKAGVLELDAFIHDIPLLNGLEVEILRLTLNELLPFPPKAQRFRTRPRSATAISLLLRLKSEDSLEYGKPGHDVSSRLRELTSVLVRFLRGLAPDRSTNLLKVRSER